MYFYKTKNYKKSIEYFSESLKDSTNQDYVRLIGRAFANYKIGKITKSCLDYEKAKNIYIWDNWTNEFYDSKVDLDKICLRK